MYTAAFPITAARAPQSMTRDLHTITLQTQFVRLVCKVLRVK